MMMVMTSLTVCGASSLPPPPSFPGIVSGGVGVGVAPPAMADPRADDPFLAFLKSVGVGLPSEAPAPAAASPAAAPPGVEADPEVGGGDRIKRTGSVLGPLLGNKLSYLTKGSHHIHFHNYPSSNKKCDTKWSLWDFKKAILAKLLEAAKLIGGGVLALKGKILTLKGHLVEIKGRKLAEKGVDLTEFGKGVVAKVLGHGTTGAGHSAPSAPSGPEASAALSIPPSASAGGYGHQSHPPSPSHGGYGPPPPPTGHGGGYGHPSGGGFDHAASLLDEFNSYGYDRNSEHRRGTIHAGLLVLQPIKRPQKSLSPRSTAPGASIAPSGSDMMSSASENSEELVQEPLRFSFSHPPLVLAPEVMDSMTTEVGVPIESGDANGGGQPQGSVASPSENTEQWVAPPNHVPAHTQAVFPSRLLSASLSGPSGSSPEGAMANVIARLHGHSPHFAGAKRR